MSKDNDESTKVVQVGHIEINPEKFNKPVDTTDLPILATRNLVLFPGVTIPIAITRDSSLELARRASDEHQPIGIVCQVDPDTESPSVTKGLHRYGVVADVFQVVELPDGSHTAIIRGRERFRVLGKGASAIYPGSLSAKVKLLSDKEPTEKPNLKPR